MKIYRYISGIVLMVVSLCTTLTACSNNCEVYYAYGISFEDLIRDDSYETELKINESEGLICYTSNYGYAGSALVTNFHLFTEEIYFQIINEYNSFYYWTEEEITKENLHPLELPGEVYYLWQSLGEYEYIAFYKNSSSLKSSNIFVYNKEY